MLRIGKVSYLNTLPLFFCWERDEVEFVEDVPSKLVELLRAGKIQAGIVSSVEYLKHPENYRVVPGLSISSSKRACSVVLFSRKPIQHIRNIYLTEASITSRILALHILRDLYGTSPSSSKSSEGADAILLIGDEAIEEKRRGRWEHVYDLGEEWYRAYKMPFVFALFLVRRDAPPWLDELIARECGKSMELFYKTLRGGSLEVEGYDRAFLEEYFTQCLQYNLGEREWRSLNFFNEILIKEEL
jgi:chorismate dehydratase